MGNTGSFNKDRRRYFMSEQFRQDMRDNKWGGSLTIPIKTPPFPISAQDNDERYTELRSKLEKLEELSISSDFYQTTFSTIPNTNLYEAYVNCLEINSQTSLNGFIPGKHIETEDLVVFVFHYRPSAPGEPMPVAESFNVEPAGSYQKDAFQGHKHFDAASLVVPASVDLPNTTDQRRHAQNSAANSAGVHDSGYGKPRIARETRPKNVAFYYHIRIN